MLHYAVCWIEMSRLKRRQTSSEKKVSVIHSIQTLTRVITSTKWKIISCSILRSQAFQVRSRRRRRTIGIGIAYRSFQDKSILDSTSLGLDLVTLSLKLRKSQSSGRQLGFTASTEYLGKRVELDSWEHGYCIDYGWDGKRMNNNVF
jgi:hypothetical protein